MNRLLSVLPPEKSKKTAALSVNCPAAPLESGPELPQCLLIPQHYERNYAYPLLVWLHDAGGNERELHEIMEMVSLRNYVSLAVRGPSSLGSGFEWPETADAIEAAQTSVAKAVASARNRFNVHRHRIFLAGAGAGGTMALRLALRSPDLFAGGASIGGCFPVGHSPLANLASARQSRLLIMHCRDSMTYSVGQVCDELALFHAAGMSVTLRQYPCGDELTTQMLHDLDVWLMEQVTGVASSIEQEPAVPSDWN